MLDVHCTNFHNFLFWMFHFDIWKLIFEQVIFLAKQLCKRLISFYLISTSLASLFLPHFAILLAGFSPWAPKLDLFHPWCNKNSRITKMWLKACWEFVWYLFEGKSWCVPKEASENCIVWHYMPSFTHLIRPLSPFSPFHIPSFMKRQQRGGDIHNFRKLRNSSLSGIFSKVLQSNQYFQTLAFWDLTSKCVTFSPEYSQK